MMLNVKLDFYLRFYTHPGQSLYISGNIPALGNDDLQKALPLQYVNGEFWHTAIVLETSPSQPLRYHYLLKNEDGAITEEWGDDRIWDFTTEAEEIQFVDTWNFAGEFENVFYTAAFKDVLLQRTASSSRKTRSKAVITHIFRVKAPLLKKGESLCLLGSGITLQEWDTTDPVQMTREGNWWTCKLHIPKESFPITYKYGVWHDKDKTFIGFESGENRLLHGDAHQNKIAVLHDGFAHLPNKDWRGAGVAIPVFSLRSKKSFGVGEFSDLPLLIDWASATGLSLVQILPVNDTIATHTWWDSYPYAAISAFALHPIYLNLEKCAGKKNLDLVKPLRKKQKELNALADVDYEEVLKIKLLAAKELYHLVRADFEKDEDYRLFFEDNKHWLIPYAAFSYLRDKNGTPDFTKWKTHSVYDKAAIEKFVAPGSRHYHLIGLQYFIQYHLHLQLREATDYAHDKGIVMKGDIPIGIYRYSCDAWMEPRLYHMDMQAGAPPDNFAVSGQNWGFPTYNWVEMEKDGFAWWRQRFSQMSNYFDGFRIDHILGFFRIWSIPMHAVQGILGHFVPAIPIYRTEFADRNIAFDHDRYTQPFIDDEILVSTFGDKAGLVKTQFLQSGENGRYRLQQAFDTQRKVETWFAATQDPAFDTAVRDGLYDLIANLILLEVEGSGEQQFHFRIAMDQTASFQRLDWQTQQGLKELYVNYYYYRQDEYWQKEAMHKLPALKRVTNMLVFGEDLGMVPRCVPEVMRQLGILSLEIQRMPKNPARQFFHPSEAPYLSVVTPSTHDMSTIRGWWEEDRALIQRFFNQELGQWGEAPLFCEPWISKAIILQHLHSTSMWSIFQLQDLLGMNENFRRENPHDERINVPADPHHYWRYRMHLTLEELLKEKGFNNELNDYVAAAGR